MTMVGGHDSVFDSCRSEFAGRSRQVVYDRVHHLACLEREARLACVIDFLRANYNNLSALYLFCEL